MKKENKAQRKMSKTSRIAGKRDLRTVFKGEKSSKAISLLKKGIKAFFKGCAIAPVYSSVLGLEKFVTLDDNKAFGVKNNEAYLVYAQIDATFFLHTKADAPAQILS